VTHATDLNERGVVVGASETRRGSTHAFVRRTGKMRDLGNLAIATPWSFHDQDGPGSRRPVDVDARQIGVGSFRVGPISARTDVF